MFMNNWKISNVVVSEEMNSEFVQNWSRKWNELGYEKSLVLEDGGWVDGWGDVKACLSIAYSKTIQ